MSRVSATGDADGTGAAEGVLCRAFGREPTAALEARLARLAAGTDAEAFVRFVAALPIAERLAAADVGAAGEDELRLAFRSAGGDGAAARAFDERYLATLPAFLARTRLDAGSVADVVQRVREKLLLPDEHGVPRFAAYAGRGDLAGLARVSAMREAVSLTRRARPRELPDDDLLVGAQTDPELAAIRKRYADAFRRALEASLRALEPRERNLLRMHLLGGVTLPALASMYGVDRATVVRWLAKARERVLEGTRAELGAKTGASAAEIESLLGLLASRADVTIERLLRSAESAPEED